MRKIIKKYGDSFVIRFSPEEMEIYELKEGDIIDVKFMKIKKEKSEY